MNDDLIVFPLPVDATPRLLAAALSGLSANSCRVYTRRLTVFLDHLKATQAILSRESALSHLISIPDHSSYNQALSAIKRLANQAAENSWLSWTAARNINGIPAKKQRGTKLGHWLTIGQAKAMLSKPNASTLPGKRDRCILALLLGCGLRRSEISGLAIDQFVTRTTATYLVDVLGKGNRLRTIAVPGWAIPVIQTWVDASALLGGPMIRSFTSNGTMRGSLSDTAIWDIVLKYAALCNVTCTPHDCRRTYARLARKGGAPLEVVQKSLGHSSISTTERYMRTGEESNAGDWFDLSL